MLLAIDWKIGLSVIILLILITIITDYISVGSIALYLFIAILSYTQNYSNTIISCSVILFLVGIVKHWINIKRILNGSEIGLRSVYKKNKA
jgi:glycerol-3-phosphate acyltransferase PlsY